MPELISLYEFEFMNINETNSWTSLTREFRDGPDTHDLARGYCILQLKFHYDL